MNYWKIFKGIGRDQKGATAIEYGLIAALIAVAAISAMQTLGSNVSSSFENAAEALDTQ